MKTKKTRLKLVATIAALIACFAISDFVTRQNEHDFQQAMNEADEKIYATSEAWELYYSVANNTTVDYGRYRKNLDGDIESFPHFFYPPDIYLEWQNGEWDGEPSSGNHAVKFADGSSVCASMSSHGLLHMVFSERPLSEFEETTDWHVYMLPSGEIVDGGPNNALVEFDDYSVVFDGSKLRYFSGQELDAIQLPFTYDSVLDWAALRDGTMVVVSLEDGMQYAWVICGSRCYYLTCVSVGDEIKIAPDWGSDEDRLVVFADGEVFSVGKSDYMPSV